MHRCIKYRYWQTKLLMCCGQVHSNHHFKILWLMLECNDSEVEQWAVAITRSGTIGIAGRLRLTDNCIWCVCDKEMFPSEYNHSMYQIANWYGDPDSKRHATKSVVGIRKRNPKSTQWWIFTWKVWKKIFQDTRNYLHVTSGNSECGQILSGPICPNTKDQGLSLGQKLIEHSTLTWLIVRLQYFNYILLPLKELEIIMLISIATACNRERSYEVRRNLCKSQVSNSIFTDYMWCTGFASIQKHVRKSHYSAAKKIILQVCPIKHFLFKQVLHVLTNLLFAGSYSQGPGRRKPRILLYIMQSQNFIRCGAIPHIPIVRCSNLAPRNISLPYIIFSALSITLINKSITNTDGSPVFGRITLHTDGCIKLITASVCLQVKHLLSAHTCLFSSNTASRTDPLGEPQGKA